MQRLKDLCTDADGSPTLAYRRAFLYVEPGAEHRFDAYKLMVAAVDSGTRLVLVPAALFIAIHKLTVGSAEIPSVAVRSCLAAANRQLLRVGIMPGSFSIAEWRALDDRQRDERLRHLGLSNNLAKLIIARARKGARQ